MKKWTVLSRHWVVENAPYSRVRRDRCQLPDGQEIIYYANEYGDWVNALVLTKEQRVVLVNQYRHGSETLVKEIPGGMIEADEPASQAIQREVLEETGYASETEPIFLGKFYPNPATSNNFVHTFLIIDAEKIAPQRLDATEEIRVEEVAWDELGNMIRNGRMPHLFSAATYFLANDWIIRHPR
ncbi:NUDIX hydrolase [Sulfobacillus harzensis]|uniref:NUDIX hydrolase n=1 Tax=Sulfobacillus harzensis TaxID=2729629 RepID=A0A7Y0L2I8_9FIRM|nr:NUDIX hydrolase [Sulfobacillus harzensis]NMP22109.1 NUDIX hydrolase [Sulfobacillus harzensis]